MGSNEEVSILLEVLVIWMAPAGRGLPAAMESELSDGMELIVTLTPNPAIDISTSVRRDRARPQIAMHGAAP